MRFPKFRRMAAVTAPALLAFLPLATQAAEPFDNDELVAGAEFQGLPDRDSHSGVFHDLIADGNSSLSQPARFVITCSPRQRPAAARDLRRQRGRALGPEPPLERPRRRAAAGRVGGPVRGDDELARPPGDGGRRRRVRGAGRAERGRDEGLRERDRQPVGVPGGRPPPPERAGHGDGGVRLPARRVVPAAGADGRRAGADQRLQGRGERRAGPGPGCRPDPAGRVHRRRRRRAQPAVRARGRQPVPVLGLARPLPGRARAPAQLERRAWRCRATSRRRSGSPRATPS